jgi:hypothetical protein
MCTWRRLGALLLCLTCWPAAARAQFTVGGEVTATMAAGDDNDGAYFNFTDYSHNALRMFRVSLSAMWRPIDRVAFLTEVRSENVERPIPYALYVRVRPLKHVPLDIQAGRIPVVFGTFARRYGGDNPLIGVPLAYQYLTSLRADAVPASADNLLFFRGLGWQVRYPVGNPVAEPGVPLVTSYRWDTGVEARAASRYVEGAFAVTSGTLANPRVDDDNHGRQLSGRVAFKPVIGLILGASVSRGEFLDHDIKQFYEPVFPGQHYRQRALGFDAEYSRGFWIVRGEVIDSRWNVPVANRPYIENPLRATAGYVEARYRFTPRYYGAARFDYLTFSKVTGINQTFEEPGVPTRWDAPVTRGEIGGGVFLTRHLTARGSLQFNYRHGPIQFVDRQRLYVAGQLSFWF